MRPTKSWGVNLPGGLLLHGEPGLGKTLMGIRLMKESRRNMFTCHKTAPNGEFVKEIKSTFTRAKETAPSIVLLDDMDYV